MSGHSLEACLAALASAQGVLQRADPGALDPAIDAALAQIGTACSADRAFVFQTADKSLLNNTHEWCAPGVRAFKGALQQIPHYVGEAMWKAFDETGAMLLPDIAMIPVGSELRQSLAAQGVKSLIAVPLMGGGEITGFVGLDFCQAPRAFDACDQHLLQSFAATLGLALQMREARHATLRREAELRQSNNRLAEMLRDLPEAVMELDAQARVLACHSTGGFAFDAGAPKGRAAAQILPGQGGETLRKALVQADRTGRSETLSYLVRGGSGEQRLALFALRKIGTAGGYLVVLRDVTPSYCQDRHLRQLRHVAELSPSLILLMDAAGRVTWMNPSAAARTGIAIDAAIGMHPFDVLGLTENARDLAEMLDRGARIDREVQLRDHAAQPYWVSLNAQALHDADGAIEGFMLIARDVTGLKQATSRALQQHANTMDALREGVALIQPDGRFIYINSFLRAFLAIPPETPMQALSWHDITPDQVNLRMAELLPALRQSGSWQGEVDLTDAEGRARSFELSIAVQEDGSFLFIARDVTARRSAAREQALLREQLQIAQSRALVAQLANGLAHDLANMLAVISQGLGALGPGHAPALGRIEAALTQAQALVQNLSHLGRQSSPERLLDLRKIVAQAADLLRPGLDSRARLVLDLPEGAVSIRGDETSVMQLALNLMLNARDALRPASKARITVRLRQMEDLAPSPGLALGRVLPSQPYAVLEVADTGTGIPPTHLPLLFEPYFSTKGQDGTGLGLSIVAEILSVGRGAAAVETLPGRGTTFRIYWPLAREDLPAPAQALPLAGRSVLLVDPDDRVLQAMSRLLTEAGAEVASCVDPRDALAALRADPAGWDVVVIDAGPGTLPGAGLGRKLRRIRPDWPIILVTEGELGHHIHQRAGEVPWLTLRKPVSETVLVAVILDASLRGGVARTSMARSDATPDS